MGVGGLTINAGGLATIADVTDVLAVKRNYDWMRLQDLNFSFEFGLFELPTPELLSHIPCVSPWLL